MFNYIWPVALIVISNALYQISAKKLPANIDMFAALAVMYIACAAMCVMIYYINHKDGNIMQELSKVNWTIWLMTLTSVGLEAGFLFSYQVGWPVSTLAICQSSFLAILLLLIGYVVFQEPVTAQKIVGVMACCAGLYFINR